jgi:hypothetical protein
MADFQNLPLIIFLVAPGQTGEVPLLIGTASCTPRLGYTIPPGDCGIQATLTLGPHPRDSPRRRTPILPYLNCRRAGRRPSDRRNCHLKLDTVLPGRPHLPRKLQLRGALATSIGGARARDGKTKPRPGILRSSAVY